MISHILDNCYLPGLTGLPVPNSESYLQRHDPDPQRDVPRESDDHDQPRRTGHPPMQSHRGSLDVMSRDVGYLEQQRKHMLNARLTAFDPNQSDM